MQSKIVLISNDTDFFEYIIPRLSLRKCDELFRFRFDVIPEKIHLLETSLIIINSENNQKQSLDLLELLKNTPTIIFSYSFNSDFSVEIFKKGAFSYITLETPIEELHARLKSALNLVSSIKKNSQYRDILVKNNLLTKNNEVFLNFTAILDSELENIHKSSSLATLVAIAPDDKSKFSIQPNQIETIILNNVRKNDILMNYSPGKYFLLLNDADITKSDKIWNNLIKKLPQGIYAGFSQINNKTRQQVINEALNNLHDKIKNTSETVMTVNNIYSGDNFKFFRQEFNKKLEQIISPVFYHIQQIYNDRLFGIKIEQSVGDGYGVLYIKSRHIVGSLRITSPGFSTINIDVKYEQNKINESDTDSNIIIDSKRITIEPNELESGLLQDLLEQFIIEFKNSISSEQ